jgi:hypothetical protein
VRGVDVAVREAAPQRLRGDVDDLELLGTAHHLVRHGLALPDARDPLHHVAQRGEVLHVHGGQDVDAGVEQLLDVLPALGVARAGRVGVGELVDQRHLGFTSQHPVEIQLLERAAERHQRHRLDVVEQLRRLGAAVRLHHGGDDVGAALDPPAGLAEHRERLAHAGGRAQVDAQLTPSHEVIFPALRGSAPSR